MPAECRIDLYSEIIGLASKKRASTAILMNIAAAFSRMGDPAERKRSSPWNHRRISLAFFALALVFFRATKA
jgi:hypothetical protein